MKVAFVVSGLPNGLMHLENNRKKVANALRNYGWIVGVETTFYSQASLLSTIDEYKNKKIDDFIFFYTGHGDASSDEGILTLRLHDGTTIDINTLHREYFSKLTINRQAIILDACYSGNFDGRKFHDKTEYLCSSDFDEESYEDTDDDGLKQSYFSYFFCEALEKLEGVITLDLIENYLNPNLEKQNSKYISIDSKMIIADKPLQIAKDDLLTPYKPIIEYMENHHITVEKLLQSVKKYTDLKMYGLLSQHDSIEKCIVHLSSTEVLYCVVKDIFKNDDVQVKQWLEENSKSCQEVQSLGEPHLVVIFHSKNDGLKYDVTFASVNMLNFSNANCVYDLADEASKNDFIKKMMSYMQNNPIVDLVLPIELMNEDINLWKVKRYFTLAKKSRVNIRSYKRYNTSKDIRDSLYKSQWEKVLDKITKGKKLADISTEDDFDEKVGTNSDYCGIASKFKFGKDEWEAVLDNDELGYIVLWLTSESSENLDALTSNLNALQKEYHKLNNKPINLMYDDPTTYYYPTKGERE